MTSAEPVESAHPVRLLAPGAAILALGPFQGLALLLLDAADGSFGARNLITSWGLVLSTLITAASVMVHLQARFDRSRGRRYGIAVYGLAILTFLFTTAPDLAVRPVAVMGLLWLFHRFLQDLHTEERPPAEEIPGTNLLLFLLIVILVGYGVSTHLWARLCLALLSYLALAEAMDWLGLKGMSLKSRLWVSGLLVVPLLFFVSDPAALLVIAGLQAGLFVLVARRTRLGGRILESLYLYPARMLAASFALLISVGTVLLSFPMASSTGESIRFLDAFFTATSATCVTGLIVLDTPVAFSTFGHGVLLVLIQIGGLGMITVSSFAALLLGRKVGLRQEAALGQLFEADRPAVLYDLIRFIVLVTLLGEGVGAVLLANIFIGAGHGLGQSIWLGVFHSISAFCNAGFALFSDSVIGLNRSALGILTLSALILFGGIGFGVLSILYRRLRAPHEVLRLPIHVRLSLLGTIVLVVGGTIVFLVLEWENSFEALGAGERLLNAFFQSVTCRTAGFNSVDYVELGRGTAFFMMLLMFVGACSNSTGGGVKVTTVMVLFSAVLSTIRGRDEAEAFGRTIPRGTVYRATVILTLSALFIASGTLALLVTQEASLEMVLYEVFSAVATVGLSIGLTGVLNSFGKLVLIVLMFIGRIGPLTLVLLLESRARHKYRLPDGNVLVG